MKEKIIYFAKLTSLSVFSFIKINLIGAVSTILVAIIGFILLSKNIDSGHSAHVSAIPYLVMIFFSKPVSSVLFCLIVIGSPFLFFALGNKYILSKIINKVLEDKSESYIYPVLDKLLVKIKDVKDNLIENKNNYATIKQKLIQQLKNENENKWIKKIVSFGLKKIKFDDVDFKNENISIIEIIKTKTIQALKEGSMPSRKSIWILIVLQWIILMLIWILPF